MQLRVSALTLLALASSAAAFAPSPSFITRTNGVAVQSSLTQNFDLGDIESEVSRNLSLELSSTICLVVLLTLSIIIYLLVGIQARTSRH
jgi:hypothetical protein